MMFESSLYKSDKYHVWHTDTTQSNISLCTCWSDPEILIKKNPSLLETFSFVGTLYSKEGVSIMLRNLALNPWVDTIYVWANSSLSNTPIGSAGHGMLKRVWENGVTADGIVVGTDDTVHKEIDSKTIMTILKNVKLIDVSEKSIEDLIALKGAKKVSTYMKPIDFPEPQRSEFARQPSEEVNFSVRGKTVLEAWTKAVDRIMRYGTDKKTEYGHQQKELHLVSWTIENENVEDFHMGDLPKKVSDHIGLDEESRIHYKQIFMSGVKPKNVAYTYGNRLFDFPGGINQIEFIIKKLKEDPVTRRAFATVYAPAVDTHHSSPPCMSLMQILSTEKNVLNMFVTFRSHDIFKAAIPNAYGLLCLHKHICDEVGLKIGSLTIQSQSAHIYDEDWNMAGDLLKCQIWTRVKTYFDEHTDIDPRGYMRIRTVNEKIHVELVSPQGEVLYENAGKTARDLAMHVGRLDLLSLPTHYVDLSIELTKAEISLKSGKPYTQDKPLILDDVVIK